MPRFHNIKTKGRPMGLSPYRALFLVRLHYMGGNMTYKFVKPDEQDDQRPNS